MVGATRVFSRGRTPARCMAMAGRNKDDDDDGSDEAEGLPRLNQSDSRLFGTQTRADQYSDWAARLRAKREGSQEKIRAAQREARGEKEEEASYWSADTVFDESKRVEQEELESGDDVSRARELYAVFNLTEEASMSDVTSAFRQLAKLHHPDRYVSADAETREKHADQMRKVNIAYKAIKQQKAGTA